MKTRFGFDKWVLEQITNVFERFKNVDKVLLFGSRANQSYKNYSDIDLAVSGKNLTRDEFLKIFAAIDDLPLIYRLDLVQPDKLSNSGLKEKILEQGIEIYSAQK